MASTSPRYAGLPTEVLENVFSYVNQHDLTNVVRVCKSFALSGRLLLYRVVELCSDDPHIDATLGLLRGERTLGVKVICATLTTRRPLGGVLRGPWIEPDFFMYWTRLRRLELKGFPFYTPADIQLFDSTLRNCCTQLRQFTFRPVFGSLPSGGFQIGGLKKVSWQSELATMDTPVTPIMMGSITTITHITFLGRVTHRRGIPYDDFLKLRFPSLESLELGSLEHSNTEIRTNALVTTFILAHPSIEHLSLGKIRPSYFIFQFDPEQLKPDSLPSLKRFEGYPENVTNLVRCRVRSIFSIISLSLCCPKEEGNHSRVLRAMSEAVADAEGTEKRFLFVKKLRFETYAVLNHRMRSDATSLAHHACMDELAHMCPNVVAWCGSLPPMNSVHFARMFAMYEHLEIICLPLLSTMLEMPSFPMEYFKDIAETCKNLKFVVARRPDYTERPDHVFILERDGTGTLIKVDCKLVQGVGIYYDRISDRINGPQDLSA
ncbi:hypothetical protein CPB84DRAFT_1798044 [Gymnopilus junonius]|uniref:F-box domain-containing protein n=1 Tax=Gymnopilus junonius TaxID=109634 RepID=A0A9P5TH11_GYMJU|nr:hypothetical protein CPB84DRAFT_1798044 [Gymnopilus junonius]